MNLEEAIKTAKTTKAQTQDVYKLFKAPREVKGIHHITGNEIWGYVYSPELFVKSDATGRLCRFFIQIENWTFHPDEIAAAKIKKDGTVIISKREALQIIDPISTRKQSAKTFESAIWNTHILRNDNYTRQELDSHNVTIKDKNTNREITLTRKEWETHLNHLRGKAYFNGWPTFSEFADSLEN